MAPADTTLDEFPKIISVDDHIVEPPELWQERLPAAMEERGPKVVFAPKGGVKVAGGRLAGNTGAPARGPRTLNTGEPGAGPDGGWWIYEALKRPLMRLAAAVGFDRDEVDLRLV